MSKFIPLLLLFFVFSFLFRSDFSFDQDLGRHIKLGEIIVQTRFVPTTNLFSYTNPDFPFINTHWLFEVLAYTFNQTVGIDWLLYLKIVILFTAITLTLYTPKLNTPGVSNRLSEQYFPLMLPIGFIFLHVLRERLDLRPEIFSFLFTALTLFILKRFYQYTQMTHDRRTFVLKSVYLLPIIQLIWVNTHIYFFVGLALQAIFLLFLGYQNLRLHLKGVRLKILATVFVLSVAASFFNPNGLKGVLYPLNVHGNYGYTIVENQTMSLLESINFTDRNFLFVKLALVLIVLSIFVGYKRKTLTLLSLLLLAFGAILAMLNVRSFPYLIFICLPFVLENFGQVKFNFFTRCMVILSGILLIIESILYLNGSYYEFTDSMYRPTASLPESGKGAMNFVLSNDLPGPIYNNFDIGSYIFYRSYPEYQVFVDGRPEAYPKEFFQNVYIPTEYDYQKFKELEKKWGFKTIIFSHTDQTPWGKAFLSFLGKDLDWNLVFLDDSMVVYLKKEMVGQKGLNIIPLSQFSPELLQYNNHVSYLKIALFLLNSGFTQQAPQFLQKALEIFPQSPIANQLKAQFLLSTNNPLDLQQAQFFLQKSKNLIFW